MVARGCGRQPHHLVAFDLPDGDRTAGRSAGVILTQAPNPGLRRHRQILYRLRPWGSHEDKDDCQLNQKVKLCREVKAAGFVSRATVLAISFFQQDVSKGT